MGRMMWFGTLFLSACADDPEIDVGPVPTWSADVAPLVVEHCARCHDGTGTGTVTLSTYENVTAISALVDAVLAAGTMPPPAADLDCAPYEGDDGFVLDDEERQVFQAWLGGGMPEGDVGTSALKIEAPHLSRIDAELFIDAPYVPDFDGINEYRCFQMDNPADVELYITGLEPIISNPLISHHTVLFLDNNGTSDGLITDPASRSWKCPEVIPDSEWLLLHAWAPGNNPVEFPDGMGMKVQPDWKPVLQMHYFKPNSSVDGVADQPGYRFTVADSVTKEIFFFPFGPEGFTIPAGKTTHKEKIEYDVLDIMYGYPLNITLYGVFPHMHVLGKKYEAWGTDEDGENICISKADSYDFSNQPTYMFSDPITVPSGGTLGYSCTWDNSEGNPDQINDPVIDVEWGEDSEMEMCYGLFYVSYL